MSETGIPHGGDSHVIVIGRLPVFPSECSPFPIDALDPFLIASVFDLSGLNERRPVLGRSKKVVETVFDVTAVREFTPSCPAAIMDFLRIEPKNVFHSSGIESGLQILLLPW